MRLARPLPVLFGLTLVSAFASAARADVPAPPMSVLDNVIVGNMTGDPIQSTNGCGPRQPGYNVIVRNVNNIPVPNSLVRLDFRNVPSIRLGAAQNQGTTVNCAFRSIDKITDGNGAVRFFPRFAGFSNTPSVEVSADGVILGSVRARSTDIDGLGGTVGLSDLAIFSANFAAQAPTPETNFDDCTSGTIGTSLPDLVIFAAQFQQSFVGPYCP
jgi:hypothetical protein